MTTSQRPAIRIDVDGTVAVLPDASSDTLHDSVGGWIEAAPTDGSIAIFVNEDGKRAPLPFNPLGHALWAHVDRHRCIAAGDWMAGPCVVTGPVDANGDVTDVPEWVLPTLATLAATARFDLPGDWWAP